MNKFCGFKKTYTAENERQLLEQFRRLEGECYLDHAGATLYSLDQIDSVYKDLSNSLYGNPHTTNTSSKATSDAVDIVRLRILDRFNTNSQEYTVIFTSGATGSLKLVAECFDYSNGSKTNDGVLAYVEDNHTSVLGMREYAKRSKAIPHSKAFDLLSTQYAVSHQELNNSNSLFVYSAQCNFSGIKYPLSWIDSVKKGALNELTATSSRNWYILLDAAAYVPTNVLNLSKYKPDFVTMSFYKMLGYPTGLGTLLVRNVSKKTLLKRYYGGGTVQLAISTENIHIPREPLHQRNNTSLKMNEKQRTMTTTTTLHYFENELQSSKTRSILQLYILNV